MTTAVTDFRRAALAAQIERVVASTPILDIHTHLYDPGLSDPALRARMMKTAWVISSASCTSRTCRSATDYTRLT